MQRLMPADDSDRRFLLPLPPKTSVSSPELFDFFKLQLRSGYDRGPAENPLWVTDRGRFGPSLVS